MFVRNIANNFFQQVFQRDDAFEPAMFVHDKAEMSFRSLHLSQNIFQASGINYIKRRLQRLLEPKFFGTKKKRHDVFAVNEAQHVIKRLFVNCQTRIPMLMKCFGDLLERTAAWNGRHFRSRHHRFAHHRVGKLKHAMNQTPFFSS